MNRAWSASAGCTVTAQALALMPLCLRVLRDVADDGRDDIPATTVPEAWLRNGGLFVWEAFVSGKHKGCSHADDAGVAVKAFIERGSSLVSDIPAQAAFSMAVGDMLATKWAVRPDELMVSSLVVAPRAIIDQTEAV